jgi:hypothetical protein
MDFVIDNLRLAELVAIVRQNEAFYDAFVHFLTDQGYPSIHAFINEAEDQKAVSAITAYLSHTEKAHLYDGIGRPYASDIAKWYFLAWTMRDAPAQRLGPLLKNIPGTSMSERKANLLNEVRKFAGPLFPEAEKWAWPTISEVMLARLEGSRRALKGTTFENTVRTAIRAVIAKHQLSLKVGDAQVKIGDETYDVQIIGNSRTILIPVKTRETMGGGHANLFTRDIHKAISVAQENGYECIPVVIAESWSGNLDSLACKHVIYLSTNPNQTEKVEALLYEAVDAISETLKQLEK